MARKDDKKLLTTLRERYKRCTEADQDNRRLALDDLKFLHEPGSQWDDAFRQERGNRPCLEFNRLRVSCKRVINAIRDQRPAGKVRPTEDADKDTAEAYEGLIRNIWANSDGDSAIDAAAEYQVGAGMGAWRVETKYSRDDAWDQDIVISAIENPLCLYRDPASRDVTGRDAEYWFLTTRISKSSYESKWPKASVIDFEGETEFDDEEWVDDDSVRIVEYWYREPVQETLLLLSDGRSVKQSDLTPEQVQGLQQQGVQVVKTRSVQCYKIKMCIASGDAILEQADWAGTMFPFIMVFGEHMVIDGKPKWWGLARFGKDAQRAYNYSRTAAAETVALSPQAKWWSTPAQAKGLEGQWKEAHSKNFPFLLFNPDPQNPGSPQRMGGADVPVALVQQSQLDAEDIKATLGIFDASLGNRSNETSGIAIRSRQQQSEIANFNFQDNIAKGVRRTWELLIDLIPRVYDSQRNIRVLGVDGSEKYMAINDGIIDLSKGKYDTVVTSGPSFSTQRQEASELYMGLAQAFPPLMQAAGDLVFKAMDAPYANEIAERWQTLLPPQIQQMLQKGKDGKPVPAEVQQGMMQVEQAMQLVQQQGQLVQAAAEELEQLKGEATKEKGAADKAKSDVQLAVANLKVQEAGIATAEAEFKLMVAETQAKMAQSDQSISAEERVVLVSQVDQALQQITAQSVAFMQDAANLLGQIQQVAQTPTVIDRATNKVVRLKRQNGRLSGEVINSLTGEVIGNAEVSRVGGELIGTVNEA